MTFSKIGKKIQLARTKYYLNLKFEVIDPKIEIFT